MTAKNYFSRRPKNVSIFPTVSSLIKCSIFSVSSSLASPHTFSSSAATARCLRTRYAPFFSPSGVSVTKPYFSNVQNPASLSDDADLDATEADTPSHSDRFFTLTGTLPVR